MSETKTAFETYLYSENREGSGKASSYLRALELLSEMLQLAPMGFEDCRDIWSVDSADRLAELRERVLEEQKQGEASPWVDASIPPSYLRQGHCSAALSQLIEFLPQHQHASKVLDLLHAHEGDADSLSEQLNNLDINVPRSLVHDPNSQDGQDRIREVKTRIGQRAFREVILDIYQNRCCLTGLDLPAVNRASHIIGWAECKGAREKLRMDPRNGLCLSATYDAAFDRKLITFDEDYRMVLSKTIREHVPGESLRIYFLNREGDAIERPRSYEPLQRYLEEHRKGGDF
ncbi:MAG: HNH endonuclease [Opitutales bacterium]